MSYSDANLNCRPFIDGRTVIAKVSEYYRMPLKRMLGNGRSKYVIRPRQIAMWICRNVLTLSFQDVAILFGKHHTTVMSACDNVSLLLRQDLVFADELDRIVRFIDPRHRILESAYHYVCSGREISLLGEIANKIAQIAYDREVATVDVTFTLLRGSPPPPYPEEEFIKSPNKPDETKEKETVV